jgi:thiol:disulfide interchange protein
MGLSRLACALLGSLVLLAPLATSSAPQQDWNDAIAWRSYEDGLRQAKSENKPVCLVIYTTWCPHCTRYARMFHDPKVIASVKDLVMVKVDKDASPAISQKYSADGEYIPRTYFLAPDGEVAEIDAGRSDYRYFYDAANPAPLLAAMQRALALTR